MLIDERGYSHHNRTKQHEDHGFSKQFPHNCFLFFDFGNVRGFPNQTRGEEKGLTIVPLALFISERGFAKLEIGLAQGKKTFDKRETMKERDTKVEMERALKR